MSGKSIKELKVGDVAQKVIMISEERIERFARATGNFNPIYFHDPTAQERKLAQKIIPEVMLDVYTSSLIGEKLPGQGSIIVGHATKYLASLPWGASVTILVKIEKILPRSNQVILTSHIVIGTDNKVVCEGKWTVSPQPAPKK